MVNKVSKSALFISIFCVLFIGILAVLANILWIETKRFSHDAISQQFDVLHQNFQSEINHVILDARSIAIQESKSTLIVDSLVEGDAKRYLREKREKRRWNSENRQRKKHIEWEAIGDLR